MENIRTLAKELGIDSADLAEALSDLGMKLVMIEEIEDEAE